MNPDTNRPPRALDSPDVRAAVGCSLVVIVLSLLVALGLLLWSLSPQHRGIWRGFGQVVDPPSAGAQRV
jgi:hypothetical protein